MAKVEVVHSGMLTLETEERLRLASEKKQAEIAKVFSSTRVDWDPTEADDIDDERRAHLAHATGGLRAELARAAAAEAQSAAPAPRRKKSRAFEDQ